VIAGPAAVSVSTARHLVSAALLAVDTGQAVHCSAQRHPDLHDTSSGESFTPTTHNWHSSHSREIGYRPPWTAWPVVRLACARLSAAVLAVKYHMRTARRHKAGMACGDTACQQVENNNQKVSHAANGRYL
jgi:hypothetical protein